jgi:PAS domain S-box-containing protein
VLGVTVVVRDVTERVRAEKDLRESEERFRSIVDVLPQYVAYTDKDLVYRFVNKTYERAFGAAAEDMVGRTLPDVIGDEAFEAARGNVQRALAGEYVHYQTDLTYPGGVRRSIDGHLVPDFSPDGGVQGYYAVLTDVSHLKEVEKKLRESRELFRKAFDNEHVAVAITRMQDGTYLEANPGFTAITGYDREEVVGKTPMELGFYDAEWRREVLDDFVAGSRNLELSYPDKFGRRSTILYSIAPIAYKGEDCLLATMVDITERKTTEAALAESEREKSLILGSISDLVVYYESPELVIKWTNRAAAESAGQSVEGLLGESCYEVWGEGGTPCEGCLVLEVFEKGRAMEMERERPDGRVWYLRAYPALDESGAVRGVVEVGRDVTDERRAAKEREKAREELRRSEKLLSLSQSVSRVGGWYRDLRNGATYWTDEHYRVLGYEPGEVVPSKELFMDHVHPDDRDFVDNARETAIAGGPDYDAEYRLVRKNGALRTVRTVGRMYPDLNGEPRFMFGSIQDVTEQKEVEEALRRSLAEKEAMLLEIHHRVKNNLQVILGLLDMTRYRTKSEEAAEVIREVHAKINSMALIHNALYREENLESIDVSGFAEMLMAQLARLYGGSRVRREVGGRRVRLSLEKAVPLGLALNEILTNAFKYAFAGGEGAIVCDMDETDGLVRVEVSDDGAGLPENFDPRTTNTLGFKLVRDLVEMQLGGEMLVDGEEGVKVGLIFPA